MKQFISADDVSDPMVLVQKALEIKKAPLAQAALARGLTLGLIFLNPSLRTRLSTQKAAQNLGMEVMVMNVGSDGWNLETSEGVIMDGERAEHVKEAAAVIGQYCDVIGLRSFPGLLNKADDYADEMIQSFVKYSGRPIISLESAIFHPLQSLADLITIEELKNRERPRVVLSWAPHVKALPQSVANSFVQWIQRTDYELVITHPPGFDLPAHLTKGVQVETNQEKAFEKADFIYAKNWSSYVNYGEISSDRSWMIDGVKMALTNQAHFMHCLPVRRNLVVADEVLDGPYSAVIQQAANREFSAQAVLAQVIGEIKSQ